MKKKLLTGFLLAVFYSTSTLLGAHAKETIPKNKLGDPLPNSTTKSWGSAFSLSSNGVGLELSKSLNNKGNLVARFGGSYLPVSVKKYQANFSGSVLIANADVKLGSIGLYADWHPFNNSFKITGGVAYMFTSLNGNAKLRDSTKQNDIMISPDDVGKITLEIKPGPITPYIGIGFGRAIPKTRFGVSFELGTYYIGSPSVTFETTKLLEPTSSQGAVLKDNLSGYQWLPKLAISFNFKLNK
jgi:hypothetical protein